MITCRSCIKQWELQHERQFQRHEENFPRDIGPNLFNSVFSSLIDQSFFYPNPIRFQANNQINRTCTHLITVKISERTCLSQLNHLDFILHILLLKRNFLENFGGQENSHQGDPATSPRVPVQQFAFLYAPLQVNISA